MEYIAKLIALLACLIFLGYRASADEWRNVPRPDDTGRYNYLFQSVLTEALDFYKSNFESSGNPRVGKTLKALKFISYSGNLYRVDLLFVNGQNKELQRCYMEITQDESPSDGQFHDITSFSCQDSFSTGTWGRQILNYLKAFQQQTEVRLTSRDGRIGMAGAKGQPPTPETPIDRTFINFSISHLSRIARDHANMELSSPNVLFAAFQTEEIYELLIDFQGEYEGRAAIHTVTCFVVLYKHYSSFSIFECDCDQFRC